MLAEAKARGRADHQGGARRAVALISEEEIVKQAERRPRRSSRTPRPREREIRLGAEDYADDILNTLEVNLTKFIAAVQRGPRPAAGPRRSRSRLAAGAEPAAAAPPIPRLVLPRPRVLSDNFLSHASRLRCDAHESVLVSHPRVLRDCFSGDTSATSGRARAVSSPRARPRRRPTSLTNAPHAG
jgi:hypothetical protein